MKKKIVFLLASISQPRCLKRINSFVEDGYEVEVFGFDRGIYTINLKNSGIKIKNLGLIPSGKGYFFKFFHAKKKLKKVFLSFQNENVVYYVFSFDLAILVHLFSSKKFIYEISDLVYLYFKLPFLEYLFKYIDLFLIRKSLLTVLTSQGYHNYFFSQKKNIQNVLVQPNRVNKVLSNLERKLCDNKNRDNLVFSYVGAFRYPNTVFRFARIIGEEYPNFKFEFHGDSHLTILAKDLDKRYQNVSYFGSFKNPEDLSRIYNRIDLVVACYDISTKNERIAEPNKLYESIFFRKPIIVSENTFLSRRVRELNCGFVINPNSDNQIRNFLDSLSIQKIREIKDSISNIDSSEYMDDNSEKILNYLWKIF